MHEFPGTLDVAYLENCPPLLSNKSMRQLGVNINFGRNTLSVDAAGMKDQPLEWSDGGMPPIVVTDYTPETRFPEKFQRKCFQVEANESEDEFGFRGDVPNVPEELRYTAAADVAVEEPSLENQGTKRQLPKGAKKRLQRITESLKNIFQVDALDKFKQSVFKPCVHENQHHETTRQDGRDGGDYLHSVHEDQHQHQPQSMHYYHP